MSAPPAITPDSFDDASSGEPVARQQVAAFVPSPLRERVQAVRARWDPETARRVAPHITLVHDAAGTAELHSRLDRVPAGCAPFAVRLTGSRCWGQPEGGIYVAVEDVDKSIEKLRRSLRVIDTPDVRYEPHVTLVHPRTVAKQRAEEAWADLASLRFDELVRIDAIAIIELDGDQWRTIATMTLAARSSET